jgi:hypothetical protein
MLSREWSHRSSLFLDVRRRNGTCASEKVETLISREDELISNS